MDDLTKRQIARNRETRDQPSFASHREIVMRLILTAVKSLDDQSGAKPLNPQPRTLTVLGAGNCQDIELAVLAEVFDEVRLIDIDAHAVQTAVTHLPANTITRLKILAPIDIATPLMSFSAQAPSQEVRDGLPIEAIQSALPSDVVPVSDVVVSTCLLSQLIDTASQITLPGSSEFLTFIQAVRRGHLIRMLQLTRIGGRAILVTDLVSSDTVPALETIPESSLPGLLFQCLQSGNFFSGLNPAVVQHDIQHHPGLAELCAGCRILPPWRWTLGPRCFAVYAVDMLRA